mmetsp:Transcript_115969/g.247862  ORF Transcript_115969/g.247862 Transcript_115969/m.247862 type:complete len:313 (+) Transcript_115969:382-1320(+)
MLHALDKVRQVLLQAALVQDRARHALCHLHRAAGPEIAVVGTLLHGIDGAHPAIPLQARPILCEEILPRRLLCAGQHATAHRRTCSQAQRFENVPRAPDATISDDRHAMCPRKPGDVVHGGCLATAASGDLLGCADGTDAHADAERVDTAVDEVLRLKPCDDVPANDLQVRELRLHPLYHSVLENTVTLAAVDNDCIYTRSYECVHPVPVGVAGAHRSSYDEVVVRIRRREGKLGALFQVCPRHQGDEATLIRDNRQLPFLGIFEQGVRLDKSHTLLRRGEAPHRRHDGADSCRCSCLAKITVAHRHQAEKL